MEEDLKDGFRRKVYTKMYNSSISALQQDQEKPKKKILPSTTKSGLREEFKKTFLPLLIDVFELRQMVRNYKKEEQAASLASLTKEPKKCPKQVLEKLEHLQHEVEESKRWCQGVILQIAEAINEAKEALKEEKIEPPSPQKYSFSLSSLPNKKRSFWQKLFGKKNVT
jgi:16S rRNA C967 or C1407 C5-methylase (RsmB/RsmF family)